MSGPSVVYLVTDDWYFLAHHLPLALAAQRRGFRVIVATRVAEKETALRATGFEIA